MSVVVVFVLMCVMMEVMMDDLLLNDYVYKVFK